MESPGQTALVSGGKTARWRREWRRSFRPPSPEPAAASFVISDEQIDAIATRVMDRLMLRLSTGAVPEVVTAVAERLLQAEIDNVKSRLNSPPND